MAKSANENKLFGLPVRRTQALGFLLRTQPSFFIKGSLLLALFAIPLFLAMLFIGASVGSPIVSGGSAHEQVVAFLQRSIWLDLLYIPSISLFFVGLSGLYSLIRDMAFAEGYLPARSFFRGIRKNGAEFFYFSLVFGVVFYLLLFARNYLALIDGIYYVPMTVIVAVLSVLLLNTALFACCSIPVYRNSLFRTLKNSFLLTFSVLPSVSGITLITFAPLLIVGIFGSTLADVIVISFYAIFGFALAGTVQVLYANSVFDKFVNKKSFPELYRKGLYNGEKTTWAIPEPDWQCAPLAEKEGEGYLKTEDIVFTYDGTENVLQGVSFTAGRGDVVCVLGLSGAGKTTLLKVLSGLLVEKSGDVYIDGKSQKPILPYRRNIGYVFQDPNLYTQFTVYQNLKLSLPKGTPWDEADEKIKSALADLGLLPYINVKPRYLSKGECQKVAVAKALIADRDMYLFDEPLSSLDQPTRLYVLSYLKRKQREKNVPFVYVGHERTDLEKFATKCLVLKGGRSVQYGSLKELQTLPANRDSLALTTENYNFLVGAVREGNLCFENVPLIKTELPVGAVELCFARKNFRLSAGGRCTATVVGSTVEEDGREYLRLSAGGRRFSVLAQEEMDVARFDIVGKGWVFDLADGHLLAEVEI